MQISSDKATKLINQLDGLFGKKPLFYLKFVKSKEYADELINGKFFANTPEYFRKLELETGERGQGDSHELLSIIECFNIQFIGSNNSTFDFKLPKAKATFQFESDNNIPMVCFVGITVKDLLLVSANETQAEFKLPFSNNELSTIKDRFGEYCVVFEPTELLRNIESFSCKNNLTYAFKKIEYCSQHTKERIEAFAKDSIDRFYYKDEDLAYQNEYRLIFDMDIPDDHKIIFDKFSEKINKFKSEDLTKNSIVT